MCQIPERPRVYVVCENEALSAGVAELEESAKMMAAANDLILQSDKAGIPEDAVSIVVPDATVYRTVRRAD